MTYQHAVNYIIKAPEYKKKNSFAGLCEWFSLQNNLSLKTKIVPITGTVGTSSCALMLSNILQKAEYRVGRLLNTHIFDFRERITINDTPIEHSVFAEHTSKISKYIKRRKKTNPSDAIANLSSQEIMLAIAVSYFIENDCDIIVIDIGKPENLFYLNALPTCPVNIITCIEDNYEDAEQTEQNLKYILSNVRRGMHEIICNMRQNDYYNNLSACCSTLGCRITIPAGAELNVTKNTLSSLGFTYRGRQYELSTSANYSIANAITVIEAAYALRRVGMKIRSACIEDGLASLNLVARLDVLSVDPTIIMDSASTPLQIVSLSDSLKKKKELLGENTNIKLFSNKYTSQLFKQHANALFEDDCFAFDDSIPIEFNLTSFEKELHKVIESQNENQILLCIGSSEYIGKTMFLTKRILNER